MLKSMLKRCPEFSLLRQGLLYCVAGWVSVMLAALAVCVELAASGSIALGTVTGAMLGVHALIGVGEGLLTAAAFVLLAPRSAGNVVGRRAVALPLSAACAIALLLSPLASGLPDGLEKVAANLHFLPVEGVVFLESSCRLPGVRHRASGSCNRYCRSVRGFVDLCPGSGGGASFATKLG